MSDPTPTDATNDSAADGSVDDVRSALAEIRRESYKATFVYASLDATCVLFAVALVLDAVGGSWFDAAVAAGALEPLGVPAPDVGTLLAVVAGAVAFGAEVRLRSRRPVAERFEAANPEVREALRTARDAAAADRTNPMARALYEDVLERLRETSSVGLLNATRLAATVVLALCLSLASVQTAVVGLELGSPVGGSGSNAGGGATHASAAANLSDATLRDGDEVLGDPTDVSAGSENLTAEVGAGPGGDGQREWNYDGDASDGRDDAAVDPQRAGFASPERVEDAALVRRYARELGGNSTDD
ncbi:MULTISPECIES: DUF7502 family protein [Halorussus]|uniref:DUF7502 family protein n=1 Tax=Halorussus TaxID=1070314 RepID=UPI00209F4E8F|nr:hypothetical protein [Halorussus vallis]USZ73921.1 hypothetical protein NGM07_10675 [Halorussus vallis]